MRAAIDRLAKYLVAGSYSMPFTVGLLAASCHSNTVDSPVSSPAPGRVRNLHAFARLYGVVRWFHPSDSAATLDWDRFAVDGARRVIDAPSIEALSADLTELFAPFAPTVHLANAGESFPEDPALRPPVGENLEVVAWQHLGYGDSAVTDLYASKRRHRKRSMAVAGYPYGALWQAVDATAYRGAHLRLRGKLRTSSNARAQLWVRVEHGDAVGFSDNMNDRPVVSQTWESAEITGIVDPDATRIVFGTQTSGRGTAWYDALELSTRDGGDNWVSIEVKDPGFETGNLWLSWNPGLGKPSAQSIEGWQVGLDRDHPAVGAASLRVEAATRLVDDELFADAPRPGETVDIDLGSGLRARVPIALYSSNGHTIGDRPIAPGGSQTDPSLVASPSFDLVAGIADVIVAWNVLEHFWPYWDIVTVDWIAELDAALSDALDDHTLDNHVTTLQRLSAALPDGHARVACPGRTRRARPPFVVDVVEGQVVVTATADPAILRGDVVLSVDGHSASAQLAEDEALASGSPQWRRVRGRTQFGTGPSGSRVTLRVRRSGSEQTVSVARDDKAAEEFSHPGIQRFDDGIYYVDLSRTSLAELHAAMEQLAHAPGVVFDVRARPSGTAAMLSHLLTYPDDSNAWLAVPHVIRPDHRELSIPAWDTSGWAMPVRQPHIAGRVAFLTGPGAASYAESLMGFVEHYHLGEIVGSPTAGANGNVAQIAEPSGCYSVFTGLRVTKHDGSRFHLVGVQPTIPASRTIAGIVAGRDEVLEKALAYIRERPSK